MWPTKEAVNLELVTGTCRGLRAPRALPRRSGMSCKIFPNHVGKCSFSSPIFWEWFDIIPDRLPGRARSARLRLAPLRRSRVSAVLLHQYNYSTRNTTSRILFVQYRLVFSGVGHHSTCCHSFRSGQVFIQAHPRQNTCINNKKSSHSRKKAA